MLVCEVHREKLFSQIEENSLVLISAGKEQVRNRDVEYPFRVHSDFRYLTGFCEPDSILVLLKKNKKQKALVFVRPKDKKQEIWQGRRLGVEQAIKEMAVDEAFAVSEFAEKMEEIVLGIETIYFSFEQLNDWSETISNWLTTQKTKVRQGIMSTYKLQDVDSLLHESRLIKSAEEIAIMRQAAQISVQGHLVAMNVANLDYEYQVQARLESAFKEAGSARVAFSSICASGQNACILHYTENNDKLTEQALILVDAGAEFEGYAGDITTTFPKNGKFSTAQKELYDLVLKTQRAVIAMIKPGLQYNKLHQCAETVITKGLIQLGILNGKLEKLLADKAYKKFFMHGTGHWLGMDVHDVGQYKINKQWRDLKSGMVLTVEPGLYISAEVGKEESVNKKYWDIGIRIEDDVLVTEQGNEVLTKGLPRTTLEIESYMAQFRELKNVKK